MDNDQRMEATSRSRWSCLAALLLMACAAHQEPPPLATASSTAPPAPAPKAADPEVERWKRDGVAGSSSPGQVDRDHLGKQYTFARYFNELRRRISDHWHPDVVYGRIDPTRSIYGFRDRLTILRLAFKPDGSLAAATIERPCGIDKLDEESLAAVKAAQPFEAPPAPLVKDGVASFRFGFMFEVSGGAAVVRPIRTGARPEGKEPIGAPP